MEIIFLIVWIEACNLEACESNVLFSRYWTSRGESTMEICEKMRKDWLIRTPIHKGACKSVFIRPSDSQEMNGWGR